jgi:3-dehydroquinate dehydratase II
MKETKSKPLVMILGGPNLGRLGQREPEIYGSTTWEELGSLCEKWGEQFGLRVEFNQDDFEGGLVGLIHQATDQADGLIINAAAYTHTSVAIRDAVASMDMPIIELHLTNPTAREEFRQTNLLTGVVSSGVFGFGIRGYKLALEGMASLLET